jgi:quercetin dioxygenase-like cupin family protein
MSNWDSREPTQPTPLSALAEYADHSVVSRTLSKGPSGTLTVFALDAGQEISEHATPYEAFALGLDGCIEFTVGGAHSELKAGELLRLPADVPHALKARVRGKMLLVMFRKG